MIKKETIDKIFDAINIVDVIGDFVNLKKRGANFVALSPFVNEKTPSFYVNPAKGIFKCFSSGVGGDAIKFVMEHEKLNYPESLRYLAKKYSIEIEEERNEEEQLKQKEEQNVRESLFNVNDFAKKYFYKNLHDSQEGLSIALSYLKERGLSPQIINIFEIGYSPIAKREFTDHAIDHAYNADVLIKAGLTKANEDRSWMVDAFNGRIVFPIHNISGRVVGFSARILTNDKNVAKYLNTAETEVFNKSKTLYGFHLAKKNIIAKDNCYLVEGQMDVVSMFEAGLTNTVASSGTSLTIEQVRQIKKFTNNITILYDGDSAGIKATDRAIEIILQEGLNARVVHFPNGDDPDSYFKKNSLEHFLDFVQTNAFDFVQYKYVLQEEKIKADPIYKATYLKEIIKLFAYISDSITRSIFIKKAAQLFDVAEQILIAETNKLIRSGAHKQNTGEPEAVVEQELNSLDPSIGEVKEESRENLYISTIHDLEKELIRYLVLFGANPLVFKLNEPASTEKKDQENLLELTIAEIIVFEVLNDNMRFIHPLYRKIFDMVAEKVQEGQIPGEIFYTSNPDNEISSLATNFLMHKNILSKNWKEKFGVVVSEEKDLLKNFVIKNLNYYKLQLLNILLEKNEHHLKAAGEFEEKEILLETHKVLTLAKRKYTTHNQPII